MNRRAPDFRLRCGLCDRVIGKSVDVYVVDGEWLRRFRRMKGPIVCQRCAMDTTWGQCQKGPQLRVPAGHIPPPVSRGPVCDSWDHTLAMGTQKAIARMFPDDATTQGAGEYVDWLRTRGKLPGDDDPEPLVSITEEGVDTPPPTPLR